MSMNAILCLPYILLNLHFITVLQNGIEIIFAISECDFVKDLILLT